MSKEPFDLESYPFTIRPLSQQDGGGFLIEYPDIPSCMSDGETPAAAIQNGRDALKSALRTIREFGDFSTVEFTAKVDSIDTVPPERTTTSRTSASPRPNPRRLPVSPERAKRSNTRSASSGPMPEP